MSLVIAFFTLRFQNIASIYFSIAFFHAQINSWQIYIHLKQQQFNYSGRERL